MKLRLALAVSVGLALLLAGCGSGDPVGTVAGAGGTLNVTVGGSGTARFTSTSSSLDLANSVTVAIRSANDPNTKWTIYTLFGLSRLTLTEVPTAALVTYVNGLLPTESSSTLLPSTVVGMVFHGHFDQSKVATINGQQTVLAQTAPLICNTASAGSFILEPQPSGDGSFTSQDSPNRRVRWSTVTLSSSSTGEEVLVDGYANYTLSYNINQNFMSYAGNLGLTAQPSSSGGGPPSPPGSGGTSTTSGGTTSGDNPPSPPLRNARR